MVQATRRGRPPSAGYAVSRQGRYAWNDESRKWRNFAANNPAGIRPQRTKQLWWVDERQIKADLHPGQAEAWSAAERIVAIIAGSQGGKTSYGPLWLWREIKRCGPGDYLAVTSTVPLSRLKMLPEFLRLFHYTLKLGTWHKGDRVYEISPEGGKRLYGVAEPSRIIFGSAINAESLESATAKAAWLDEVGQKQFRLESWEAIQRRLALHQGRVLMTTTPYSLGWLYTAIYQPWLRQMKNPDQPQTIRVIQFPSNLNPSFPDEAMEEAKRNLPPWRYQLFYEGKFTKPEGLIYGVYTDDYWPNGQLVHHFAPPLDWPVYIGLDFGGANTAMVFIAWDRQNNMYYQYAESLSGGMTTKQHVEDEFMPLLGGRTIYGVLGGAPGETQQRMDWNAERIPVEAPDVPDVEAQIDRVLRLLGGSNYRIMDNCLGTRSELGSYSRVLESDGTPTDKIDNKAKYHRLDALRYIAQKLEIVGYRLPPMLISGGVRGWGV